MWRFLFRSKIFLGKWRWRSSSNFCKLIAYLAMSVIVEGVLSLRKKWSSFQQHIVNCSLKDGLSIFHKFFSVFESLIQRSIYLLILEENKTNVSLPSGLDVRNFFRKPSTVISKGLFKVSFNSSKSRALVGGSLANTSKVFPV